MITQEGGRVGGLRGGGGPRCNSVQPQDRNTQIIARLTQRLEQALFGAKEVHTTVPKAQKYI